VRENRGRGHEKGGGETYTAKREEISALWMTRSKKQIGIAADEKSVGAGAVRGIGLIWKKKRVPSKGPITSFTDLRSADSRRITCNL